MFESKSESGLFDFHDHPKFMIFKFISTTCLEYLSIAFTYLELGI